MTFAFNRWPLARQLWLLLVTPTALALALYGVVAHQNRQRILLEAATAELGNYASLVQAALGRGADPASPGPMRDQMEALARADRVLGLAGYDASGHVIAVTRDLSGASATLADVARRALADGHDVVEARQLDVGPTLVRTLTVHPASAAPPYAFVIVLDLNYIAALSASLDRGLVLTSAVVIGLIAALTAWISRRMVGDPVGAIVRGAGRIAAGDLDARVPAAGAREIAMLGASFNAMGSRLELARDEAHAHAEQRALVERKLRDAQALAAAGQIAASVAHEIGSPLNVILGRARRGAANGECPEPIRRELDAIATQSERITRVVSGLLTLARPAPAGASNANVAQVATAVAAFLEPDARERGVSVRVEPSDTPLVVALGPDALFQVLFNLVRNGVQSQPCTCVTVRASASRDDGRARIDVEDDGPGVAAADSSRIFDAFYTTKAEHGGSGLGLAIVAGILRDAGGAIEVDSTAGRGALLRAILPLANG
jgi:signal transduction histidine kinase